MPGQIEVLLLGSFHMANPGRDMGNMQVDDVLAETRQREIEAVADTLAKFGPTKVAVEYPVDRQGDVARVFQKYCDGARDLQRNENEQIGFRVARATGAAVIGIDVEDEFYDPAIEEFLERHPDLAPFMAKLWSSAEEQAAEETEFLATHTIAESLRHKNTPEARHGELAGYIEHLVPIGIGANDEYPGPEMAAYWYRRNLKIATNLYWATEDGDRVLIVYGAGHIPVLEHILGLTPGVRLASVLDYLP